MDTAPSLLARVFEFAAALIPYWWAVATGFGPALLIGMLHRYRNRWAWLERSSLLTSVTARETRPRIAMVFAVGGILYASFQAFDDVNITLHRKETELVTLQRTPYIALTLVIDSLNENEPDFHIEVENTGSSQVTLTRYNYRTSTKFNRTINLPDDEKTIIPPKNKITIPGIMLTGIVNVPCALDVTMVYYTSGSHTALYKFFVDHSLIPPERFFPVKWQQIEGETDDEFKKSLFAMLENSQGTIAFDLPERKSDGSINIVTFSGNNRRFLFDPNNQIATFSKHEQTGEIRIVQGGFETGKGNGRHFIIMAWNDENRKLSIMVDGKEFH
jgi:hypothetical protein